MVRTQVQLPEVDYERLRAIALQERRSLADCIREGVRLFLRKRDAPSRPLRSIAGAFKPLPLSDLKDHDRHLAEATLESKRRGPDSKVETGPS